MADNWQSPTGYNDPDSKWSSEANIYDADTGTFGYQLFAGAYYLEVRFNYGLDISNWT